jgi:predicted nuclease with TOPRIM domain
MNVEMAHSEEMFRKHKEEYEKLRHEVNELRCFKDLWMAHGYTSSVVCDATVHLPGTQEAS